MEETHVSLGVARTILLGLVIECPLGLDSATCVLNEYRKQPFPVKFNWLQSLEEPELRHIYTSHCVCQKTVSRDFSAKLE